MASCGRPRSTPPRYPAIETAIIEKGGTYRFFEETGIRQPTYYYLQSSRGNPTLNTIQRILQYTGLDFETAFAENKNAAMRVQDA